MAEQVQAVLDRMVPPLKDLLDKGVFNEIEIKSIVERRRESEYLLRRRQTRRSDYATYIEAEKNLEKLRVLRNKKVIARRIAAEKDMKHNTKNTPGKRKSGSSIGDASIVQHIHLLYVRAKRKWKQDLTWHIQHAEFAKESKSHSMLSKIYAEALQVHPRNASLWIEAASHEYFGYVACENDAGLSGGGSIKNARVLLQRGLRINPDSRELWLQYFCLELHYIQKLRGRRDLLQLGLKKSLAESKEFYNGGGDDGTEATQNFYKEAKLPRIIYKNATKSISSDLDFRLQFIDQCRLFPETQNIVDEIMLSVEEDFGNIEEAWIARARLSLDDKTNLSGSFLKSPRSIQSSKKRKYATFDNQQYFTPFDILEEATDKISTQKMFIESISFARAYIRELCENGGEDNLSNSTQRQIAAAVMFLKKMMKKVEEKDIMSPELAVEFTDILVADGSTPDALRLIKKLTENHGSCCGSSRSWLKRAEITARICPDPSLSCEVLRKALKVVPMHDEGHLDLLSKLFLDLLIMSATKDSSLIDKEIASIYDKILVLNRSDSGKTTPCTLPSLSLAYFQFASTKGDIGLVRKIYAKLLYSSNYPNNSNKTEEELFHMENLLRLCIGAEKVALKFGANEKSKHKLKRLCDAAFDFFMKNDRAEIADTFATMMDINY